MSHQHIHLGVDADALRRARQGTPTGEYHR